MPETNKEPMDQTITKQERQFSPSQSDSEHGNAPRDRRADTPDEGGEYNSVLSTEWPFPVEVASKLGNVKLVKRIPIVKNPRFFELVAKFGGTSLWCRIL